LRGGTLDRSVAPDRRDGRWPDEPDEFDPIEQFGFDEPDEFSPEKRWGDPERDLPNVPEAPQGDEIDPELQRAFWASVVLANVALGGLSLGLMLIYFRGQWTVGLGAVGLGAFALARTYLYYRQISRERLGDEEAEPSTDDERDDGTESESDADRPTP
jgi:hypothetical protein